MKNRFGFIPIVLPAIVMVLIIGLINLTGPQGVQAQAATSDVSEEDARLTALSLTYTGGPANILMPAFMSDRGDYTAMVEYDVTGVTLAATAPTGYTATYGSTGAVTTATGTPIGALTIASGTSNQVTTITVTVTEDSPDTGETAKTATYVIVLTHKKPDIPANGARLSVLGLQGDHLAGDSPPTTGDATLTRMDGGDVTFGAGTAGINMFKASVAYGVRTVVVVATPATAPPGIEVSSITPGKTPARATFDAATATDTDALHRVNLPIGDTTIKVRTRATGANAEYTIVVTRRAPELAASAGISLGRSDGRTPAPALDPVYGATTRDYTVKVAFDVDSTTIPVDATGATRRELKRITVNGRLATTSSDATTPYNVILPVGKTVVGVEVDQWLRNFYNEGEDATPNGSTSTGKYTVTIEREKPKLAEFDATSGSDAAAGIVLRYGNGQVADTVTGLSDTSPFGFDMVYSPDEMAYKATVPYRHTRVTLHASAGTSPASGGDMNKVSFDESPDDADGGNVGYQVDLSDDDPEKTVIIRAEANDDRIYTEYRVTLTLASPMLNGTSDVFALCEDGDAAIACLAVTDTSSPAAGQIVLMDSAGAPVLFDSGTMEYGAEVDYEINEATFNVVANDGTADDPRRVQHTMPVAKPAMSGTTATPATSTLMVGDNVFAVGVGVEGNTSTYMVTLTRNEPQPELEFTVLNGEGDSLGSGPLALTLDAASRNYNLVNATDITDDDLLTATDVRVCVADADDGDLDDVRVSINGVTVPDCSEDDDSYLERVLNEVTTNLEFDIDHPGDPSGTLHTVSISRNANSVPVFPANHILRSRTGESGVLAVHNTTITPTVELPMAVSGTGNGTLTYQLLSVEAGGPSTDLPQGLTYDLPTASGNGSLGMSPSILDSSDRAVFNLILKVTDSDAITASDEDTIPFTIIVFRDASLLPAGAVIEPRAGDLSDLQVLEDVDGEKVDQLEPDFSLLVYSYEADVFTDTTEVDFVATASSDATVRLEGNETSNQSTTGDDTTHTWQGYKLHIGPGARNTYRVTVEEDGTTRTYTVRVERELAKRPMFSMDSAVMSYYEGISLDDLPDSAAELPEATEDSGNGALDYALERRRDDAPDKDNFLGLTLEGETSTPVLSGTPKLDDADFDKRLSDRSEAYGLYTVNDADMDRTDSDTDTMNIDVKVYRDVTLGSYTVSGRSSGDLGPMSKVYNSSRTHSYESLESYRFNVAHDVTTVTFGANARGADASIVSISPADADGSTDGHQVNLVKGDNVVTVTVGNGIVRGTHQINLKRPGLQLIGITITEDEDARDNSRLSDDVELDPDFSRDVYEYTATVETWVRSVQVRATAADANARVFVNTFEIPEREGYSVVDLDIGETTIVLGASVGTDEPDPRYTVVITRKSSSAPAFEMEASNYTRMEGVDVAMAPCTAILLPTAEGGDGTLEYFMVNEEQLPPGLFFDVNDDDVPEITGTPTLDEGYESDFDLILAVKDSDADTSDADGDTTSFTITITNDQAAVDEACAVATPEPEVPANQLSSLLVTYTLDGRTDIPATMWSPTAFMPGDGGPYTVSIPFGATDVQVTAVRADDGATISMNSVRIASGVKLDLPPQAEIAVRHPDFTDSMVYTLVTERISNTAPTFGGATIDDYIFESGMDIDSMTLPMATGGNRTLTYTLEDHEGNLPDGLMFDASTRELSGRPALVQDADSTLYRMTYMVEDADGQTDDITFNITVCDPDRASGCEATPVEPTPTMTVTLTEWRSNDGTSATITWTPDSGAMNQAAFMVAANAGVTEPSSMDDLDGSTYTLLDASGAATVDDYLIPADTYMLEVTGLTAGTTYVYGVISWDGSAWGAWELVNFGQ